MPIRFSTEAANADRLVDDSAAADSGGGPPAIAGGNAARDALDKVEKTRRDDPSSTADGKPGKDINAAGFVKDKDAGKP